MSRPIKWRFTHSPEGDSCLRIFSLVLIMALLLPPMGAAAAGDWLKIEEEKPLGAEPAPGSAPEAATDDSVNATPEKQKMYRYLSHFDEALQEADKVLREGDGVLSQVDGKAAAQQAERVKMARLAKELVPAELEELLKKFEELSAAAKAQDGEYDRRAGELVKKAEGMCQKAKEWAKESDPEKRKKLFEELKKEKEELKKERDQLYSDIEKMVAGLRGVYRPLEALLGKRESQKDAYAQKRKEMVGAYAVILQSTLDIFDLLDKRRYSADQPFWRQITKAKNAAAEVKRMLQGNTPWISDPEKNRVLSSLEEAKTIEPLVKKLKEQDQKFVALKPHRDRYWKLAPDGAKLALLKKALAEGNMLLVYSWADDEDSRLIRRTLGAGGEPQKALDAIKERYDERVDKWKAMKQKVLERWGCVKDEVKPRVGGGGTYRGKLSRFRADSVPTPHAAGCPKPRAECRDSGWLVEAVVFPGKKEIRFKTVKLPQLRTKRDKSRGLECGQGGPAKKAWIYVVGYDPSSGALKKKSDKKGLTIKGNLSDSKLTFELHYKGIERNMSQTVCGSGELEIEMRIEAELDKVSASSGGQGQFFKNGNLDSLTGD